MYRAIGIALIIPNLLFCAPAMGRDWIHWRGPEQNGLSREIGLPDSFDPAKGLKGNVIWQQPYGGRSAPLVMDGRLYINQGYGEGYHEAERVLCFEEKSGKLLWEYHLNVYHADIVTNRLAWTSLTADPATGYVYNHATSGDMVCLDKDGKLVWQRQLTEEFGRISGYGGRIVSPIFDSGLIIVGMINSGWGDLARGANRFIALDARTGQVVWWSEPGGTARPLTYQSNPVVSVISGQRMLISGGAEGALFGLKLRTGEKLWSYQFGAGAINPSPVVDGNLVYCAHGEENPEGGPIGRVICVDASQIDPKTLKPKLVWEYRKSQRFGLSSPALADGRLYLPDDSGDLYCFNAKNGRFLWKYRYGTEVRGAPLIADGRVYIFDVKARMLILQLNGDRVPDEGDTFEYKFRDPKGLLNETNGTPIAVNGRVYFVTRTDLYCIGDPNSKGECGKYTPLAEETPYKEFAIAGARLFPAEITAHAGQKVNFNVVLVDANGREVKNKLPDLKPEWSIVVPPPPPAKDPKGPAPKGPAPLKIKGDIQGTATSGTLVLDTVPNQQGYVEFALGPYKARGRVRVAPTIPYQQDFEAVPEGAVPGGWINAQGKFFVKRLPDGNKVLAKFNTFGPQPVMKANTYITTPDSANYTVEADVMGTLVRDKMPDMGILASRYTLVMDGKTDPDTKSRSVRLTSWEARPRINIGTNLNWDADKWYRMKLRVEPQKDKALIQGKVWLKGSPEPGEWTLEFVDPSPNREGGAGLYGYVSNASVTDPGTEIFYDNISIVPNK